MTREEQLANTLAEIYGAALEMAVLTPPSKVTREQETFIRTVSEKCKALGITAWRVKFTEAAK